MFERFTDTARRVVVYAKEEALLLDHDFIGTEHILLGLLHDDTETAVGVLTSLGAMLTPARAQVEEMLGRGERPPVDPIPFTARAKKVLELSLREALQLGHNYIGSEHILLGLLREEEGGGTEVLRRLGIDAEEVRRGVLAVLRAGQQQRPSPGVFGVGGGSGPSAIESRLTAIEDRLERIERLLRDGSGRDSA
ncbi:Clp protease N-terminal domain-containing protein [Actinoallomurus acaciae]|uniref:Clp protease N-terminal domain-containing protein n=1 Tax=Actinoallomurus acaciae TaxID=502577 RepID=A0ABV5YP47_9ACTN